MQLPRRRGAAAAAAGARPAAPVLLALLAAAAAAALLPAARAQTVWELVPLSASFEGEQQPACVIDKPSRRWTVVAARTDREAPLAVCFNNKNSKCVRGNCCTWYKTKKDCVAHLGFAREERIGAPAELLSCGKRLCDFVGKSGFDVPGSGTWCEKAWELFYGVRQPNCKCVNKVPKGTLDMCKKDP